jgi:hypothetical protein
MNYVLGDRGEGIENQEKKWKKDVTSPGWRKTGTSTPRLIWLRILRGKAQPSRGVSSPVPDLCPTPPCRVRWKRKGKNTEEELATLRKNELCRQRKL